MWSEILLKILYVVIITVIPILTKYIVNYIENLQIKTENDMQKRYINDAKQIISDIVISVNQTYVERLKKESKFTKESQIEAFNIAYANALLLIKDDTKKIIDEFYGDFDTFIKTEIESYVNAYKR